MKRIKTIIVAALCIVLAFNMTACIPFISIPDSSSADGGTAISPLKNIIEALRGAIGETDPDNIPEDQARDEAGNEPVITPGTLKTDPNAHYLEPGDPSNNGEPEKEEAENKEPENKKPENEEAENKESGEKTPDEESEAAKGESTAVSDEDNASIVPKYYHYDQADFEALLDNLKKASEENDEDAMIAAYDVLYNALLKIDDLYASAFLTYSDDVSNDESDSEVKYTEKTLLDCTDDMSTLCHELVESGQYTKFYEHLGDAVRDYFAKYMPKSPELKEIYDRITDLQNQYYDELNKLDSMTVEYSGGTITFEELNGDKGTQIAQEYPLEYLDMAMELLKRFNDISGPIYVELIKLNDQLADFYGYDSYAEYAYKVNYQREYSLEDAENFCNVVKEKIAPLYYQIAYSGTTDVINYDSTIDGLLEDLGLIAGDISPIAESAYKRLTEEKLYDLGYESDRIDSSYTSVLSSNGTPYIFAHLLNKYEDLNTVTHEFGHFSYFNQFENRNYFLAENHLDILEVHSNGFQLLSTKYYDEILGDQAGKATADNLLDILYQLVSGCMEDEFQRKVYENPDMTLDEINALYTEIAESYGAYTIGTTNYEWCFIPHTFTSPMYYLSYAISAANSLEIWDIAQSDFGAGVKAWENLVEYADNNEGYFATIEECGLTPFTNSEKVEEVCNKAFEYISQNTGASLNFGYDDGSGYDFNFDDLDLDFLYDMIFGERDDESA